MQQHDHLSYIDLRSKARGLLEALRSCRSSRDAARGRALHHEAMEIGLDRSSYVASGLVAMYGRCGSMADARRVFDGIAAPDTALWNSLLWGYAAAGDGDTVLSLIAAMQSQQRCDARSFAAALKACAALAAREQPRALSDGRLARVASLDKAMFLAARASSIGADDDPIFARTLMEVYAKCGDPEIAHAVFDKLLHRDVAAWTLLVAAYADNGRAQTALEIFASMTRDGARCPPPNSRTFVAALNACACSAASDDSARLADGAIVKLKGLETGMAIHARLLVAPAAELDKFVLSSLMDMYVKCGSLRDAVRVFHRARLRDDAIDAVSWTVLVLGFAASGEPATALDYLERMLQQCAVDCPAFAAGLKACCGIAAAEAGAAMRDQDEVKMRALEIGMALHAQAKECGCEESSVVANALLEMYAKSKAIADARSVFDRLEEPDPVSCALLMLGYVDNGMPELALDVFASMDFPARLGPPPFLAALKACGSLAGKKVDALFALETGMAIHALWTKSALDDSATVSNSLVDMYAKCGSFEDASRVFHAMPRRDAVAWNTLISGSVDCQVPDLGIRYFQLMISQRETEPDAWTFAAALKALASLAIREEGCEDSRGRVVKMVSLERCMAIHTQVGKRFMDAVLANTLLDVYSKCGSAEDARRVFYKTSERRNPVSWNSFLWCCAENGEPELALKLFRDHFQSIVTRAILAPLAACASFGDLITGKEIHALFCRYHRHRELSSTMLATSLLDFYAKCGRMVDAQQVFDSATCGDIDIVGWNALISGYGRAGDHDLVLELFDELQDRGPQLNDVTFICLLTACNHGGLVHKAKHYFEVMLANYRGFVGREHYHCMIDTLGRANQLDAAVELLETMPFNPTAVTWTLLLDASSKWKNPRVGNLAFQALVNLGVNPAASSYILAANMSVV